MNCARQLPTLSPVQAGMTIQMERSATFAHGILSKSVATRYSLNGRISSRNVSRRSNCFSLQHPDFDSNNVLTTASGAYPRFRPLFPRPGLLAGLVSKKVVKIDVATTAPPGGSNCATVQAAGRLRFRAEKDRIGNNCGHPLLVCSARNRMNLGDSVQS